MPTELAVVNRRWRLESVLGEGAEARVYLATDLGSGVTRALKALHHGDAAAEARLRWEFAALSGLEHSALVRVHDLARAVSPGPLLDGQLFFTADHIAGRSPEAALAGRSPTARARWLIDLVAQVASALDALHGRGLIHHDVKPDNLIVDGEGRVRLLDLGLAAARQSGGVRGSPAYLAPEALLGGGDARVDLYALGATIHHLWSGQPPFAGATVAEVARAVLAADGPPPLAPKAPAALDRIVRRLLARDPSLRHGSARILLEDALRAGATLDGDVLPRAQSVALGRPALVGRAAELAALDAALAVGEDGSAPSLVVVSGPAGSGRSRVIEEALRRSQLRAAAGAASLTVHGPTAQSALATLGVAAPSDGDPERRRAATVAAACDALARRRAILYLASVDDPLARALAEAAAAGAAAPSVVLIETRTDDALAVACATRPGAPGTAPSGRGARMIGLGPLSEDDTVRLIATMRDDLDDAFGRAVHRAATGLPALAVELTRAAASAASAAGRASPSAKDVAALDGASLTDLVARRLVELPAPARAVAEALSVLGGAASPKRVAEVAELTTGAALAALALARAAGVVALSDDSLTVALPTAAHREAIDRMLGRRLGARRRAELHRRALPGALDLDERARHLAVVGSAREAVTALVAAGDVARARVDLGTAAARYRAAVARASQAGVEPRARPSVAAKTEARLRLAEVEVASGDYRGALASLDGLAGSAATLLAARALQRSGDDAAAEARLRRGLRARSGALDPKSAAAMRGLLSRVLLARGRAAEALAACAAGAALPDGVAAAPVLEAAGWALLYLGRADEAEASFVDAEQRARAAGDVELLGRAQCLVGTVAQRRGDFDGAATAYAEALAAAEQTHDIHAAAVYAQNLGAVRRELGDYERALSATEAAARDLGRLGKQAERAVALFNLGNLLLSVGDLDGAERARAEAESLARSAGDERQLARARSLAGDLLRRGGDPAGALAAYRSAEAIAEETGDRISEAWARLGRAEVLGDLGRTVEAEPLLVLRDPPDDAFLAGALAVARLRVALAASGAVDDTLVAAVDDTATRARAAGRRDAAFHAEVTLARAYGRAGDLAAARATIARAASLWEEIRMKTPDVYRERLDEDPDAKRLRVLADAVDPGRAVLRSDGASPPSARAAVADDARLRRLVAINKRLASELRLGPLLELIIDAVIELTRAERGFVLLRKADAATAKAGAPRELVLEVKVARNIDQRSLEAGDASLSRSIAERAAREGTPVVTIDAAGDQRFEAARSVSDLKLRSVLAVPLLARGEVVGCLYVDHRLRAGAFGDDDVALVLEFADQAAIAVENARLLAENQRRGREVSALAAKLELEVASQRAELGSVYTELRQNRAALEVRYDYRNLVGRTPRMMELFRLLDRLTDTALPVVIYGESGTGKELVARALHHNGPRSTKPYVSENCAAIPETLLEAALFGHARGAFTGADAERRGLFEIADGGTLFLDEVGEMSPGMQSKLLRVLQDGEFRRVGGERGRKVDVRIIAASNRDLGRLVEEGKFREDLFYRLNVVRVALPPLRERREDIPLLVDHFLKKQAAASGQPPKRIARAALGKLTAHRWPGNVRELENELMRAAALGGETLTVDDLSPQVAATDGGATELAPDDLSLHERVERLERSLLREALGRSSGNQSHAARLLGLSRYGLQKKLKRYRMERT